MIKIINFGRICRTTHCCLPPSVAVVHKFPSRRFFFFLTLFLLSFLFALLFTSMNVYQRKISDFDTGSCSNFYFHAFYLFHLSRALKCVTPRIFFLIYCILPKKCLIPFHLAQDYRWTFIVFIIRDVVKTGRLEHKINQPTQWKIEKVFTRGPEIKSLFDTFVGFSVLRWTFSFGPFSLYIKWRGFALDFKRENKIISFDVDLQSKSCIKNQPNTFQA